MMVVFIKSSLRTLFSSHSNCDLFYMVVLIEIVHFVSLVKQSQIIIKILQYFNTFHLVL